MKIQNRLSLNSSIVFGVIFAAVALLTYGLFHRNTNRIAYANLEKTAYITAWFYLEEDELDNEEFSKIKAQFDSKVSNSFYQLYDIRDSICYGSDYQPVNPVRLDQIRTRGAMAFPEGDFLCYGIFYEDNQGDFVVISRERSESVNEPLKILMWTLIAAFATGVMAIILLSKQMANRAYRPFRDITKQVNNISANNLDVRIASPGTQDELQDLIDTFNSMLEKIAETFVIQKNFVSYVSHEFRTPLASMQGNLEVFSMKDRSPAEYKALSEKLVHNIVQLEEILGTLIVISDLRNQSPITSPIRVDEVIWEIVSKVKVQYPSAKISVNLEIGPDDEKLLLAAADRTQILMALFNLIENAVKFSQGKQVGIVLSGHDGRLSVAISDRGIGIPPEKLANINKPFYRAENANQIIGSGIGLSIALRILEKNGLTYTIESHVDAGTKITVLF